jgi:hypothetical protein
VPIKTCSKCKRTKSITDFIYRKDRGCYQSICKECKVNADYDWSLKHKDLRRKSKTKSDRNLRQSKVTTKIKDGLRSRLNKALKDYCNGLKVSHIRNLGCSIESLVQYIENQFYPHPVTNEPMTWDNKGVGKNKWQIDHIIPFCSVKTEEDLLKVVHYSNLRPMWTEEHLIKSATERS